MSVSYNQQERYPMRPHGLHCIALDRAVKGENG